MKDEPNRLTGSQSEPISSESEKYDFVSPDEVTASSQSSD